MLGIPSKEIKTTLANIDRTLATAEVTLQQLHTALVTVTAIAEDAHAVTSELRRKLLDVTRA